MIKERNWLVLFIGGASGMGKSRVAYKLAEIYKVNVIEVDDICQALKATTTIDSHPAIHYFSTGVNWKDIGISGNVKWLSDVSRELVPALKAIVVNHLESNVPLIIEGDFISPEIVATFDQPGVRGIFIHEPDHNQVVQNYLAREGGQAQHFRAEVSVAYGEYLKQRCHQLNLASVTSRPWPTIIERIETIL